MTIHIEGPFGGCDEQAETDAYEALCGSVAQAQRLFQLRKTYKSHIFDRIALQEGFTVEQIEALWHLQ